MLRNLGVINVLLSMSPSSLIINASKSLEEKHIILFPLYIISSIIRNIPSCNNPHKDYRNHLLRILSLVFHNRHILLLSHDVFHRLSDTLFFWNFPYQKEIPYFAVFYCFSFSFPSVLIITSDSVKSSSQYRH